MIKSLMNSLEDKLGKPWASLDLDTIYGEMGASANRDMIGALYNIYNSDRPFNEWSVFEKVVLSLNGHIPIFEIAQRPSVEAISAAIKVMRTIEDKAPFSSEVKLYVAIIFFESGTYILPEHMKEFHEQIVTTFPNKERLEEKITYIDNMIAKKPFAIKDFNGEEMDEMIKQITKLRTINQYTNNL